MSKPAQLHPVDKLISGFDLALRTCTPGAAHSARPSPAGRLPQPELSDSERRHAAGLMRINHTGEVCAQALYAGQAATARLDTVRDAMEEAASEEIDHLAWCDERLAELDSRPSLLNPLFYGLSFGVGALAGLAGDRWSLGFVAETEQQVCDHLQDHQQQLPVTDSRSQAILAQMIEDERQHGETARSAGGTTLPTPVRHGMSLLSQVMKAATYKV